MRVLLRGEGVAIACCAALLGKASIPTAIERQPRRPAPVTMLSDQALALVRDVIGHPTLWADLPRIDRRIVAWGSAAPVVVPHAATVVSGQAMAAALDLVLDGTPSASIGDFTICGAAPFPFGEVRRFGARLAAAIPVDLTHDEDPSACWVEATATGWLFLIPTPSSEAWLLGVGAPIEALLDESRLIAPRVRPAGPATGFDTSPSLLVPPYAEDGLACGSAALTFDPICGDGTAQAAREAILASAVVVGLSEGGDGDALLAHYGAMLTAAMRRHLALSLAHYQSGGDGPWWQEQAAALAEGHAWCTARLARMPEPRFQLRGDRLVAREAAA